MNALDDLGVPPRLGKPPYEYGSKPGKPHGEPQNSWYSWMFIPRKLIIGFDPPHMYNYYHNYCCDSWEISISFYYSWDYNELLLTNGMYIHIYIYIIK